MDRSEQDADDLLADIARRLAPVVRHWPAREAAALVERMAVLELKYRDRAPLSPPPPPPPPTEAEREQVRVAEERQRLEFARIEASRLPSAPACPAPTVDPGALGDPSAFGDAVPAAAGAAIRLPVWLERGDISTPTGTIAYWSHDGFEPCFDGGRWRGQEDPDAAPPFTTLEARQAASGQLPERRPARNDEWGVYVEESSCTEVAGGRVLRIHARRFQADYYPDEVDEYVVDATWDLGGGAWLALEGRSLTRAGQKLLLAAVRTLHAA